MAICTRCNNERKTLPIYRPQGMTWLPPSDFNEVETPKSEYVCGDCLTDDEIERELGLVVAFVMDVLIKRFVQDAIFHHMIPALETVRTMYMTRNNNADQSNRGAAIRALGLGPEG